ncbi:unnamed protein product [Nezara viridula]|uniref:Uncharacterized protein n=1 Tax=Nezara viridula TaxID=85310 RepID=A0A9P0HSX1_NEZVI|nr:unnamed protein product [Nezara viridula]
MQPGTSAVVGQIIIVQSILDSSDGETCALCADAIRFQCTFPNLPFHFAMVGLDSFVATVDGTKASHSHPQHLGFYS